MWIAVDVWGEVFMSCVRRCCAFCRMFEIHAVHWDRSFVGGRFIP